MSLVVPCVSFAVQVENLYQAHLPVASQTDEERNRGVKEGLAQVLVKVSGDSSVLARPGVAGALKRAQAYVSEVGYSRLTIPGEDEPGLGLVVSFSQQQVDRLLRREQLQIWPASRPELLTWLVIDTIEDGKQHVDIEQNPELHRSIEYHMTRRSAPLLKPLLDLQDRLSLPAVQAWKFNRDMLKKAASRYGAKNWLVIRLYQNSQGAWRGASWLQTGSDDKLENFSNLEIDQLIAQAVDFAVDRMAENYAFVPELREEPVEIVLENVKAFDDFNRVTQDLENLEVVRQVNVKAIDTNRLTLLLLVDGSVDLLLAQLARDQRFKRILEQHSSFDSTPLTQVQSSSSLRFRWGPE